MAHPPDFTTVSRNGELCQAIPALADLTPELLSDLWQRMPKGNLPKAHIFAAGIALAVEAAIAAKELK